MAKTVGKDKGSGIQARLSSGAADPVSDEPQAEDLLDSDDTELAPEPEDETRDLAPASSGAMARRPSAAITRPTGIPPILMGNPVTRYLAESFIELSKVTRPTYSEAWTMTLVVVAMSAFVAAVLGLVDIGLLRALSWLISLPK